MFVSPHVPMYLEAVTLKQDAQSGEKFARCTFVVEPILAPLVRERGEEIAAHLLDEADQPRTELQAVTLRVGPRAQRLTWGHDAALPPVAEHLSALLGPAKATRCEDKESGRVWLRLGLQADLPVGEGRIVRALVESFGAALVCTWEPSQRDLPLDDKAEGLARAKEAAARLAEAGAPGSSVSFGFAGEPPVTLTPDDAQRLRDEAKQIRKRSRR